MSFSQTNEPLNRRAQLTFQKKFAFCVSYALFMIFCLLCVGELSLRVLSLTSSSFQSAPFRQYDPDFGISLIPNKQVIHSRGCFKGEVVINRWGMRDRDRSLEKSGNDFRIALLGDSVIEGVHVKPDEVVNIRMEKILEQKGYGNVEVLNFGVEGIGTTQELLFYKERVRRFRPDLVVLLFITGNDVMNNSSTLQPKVYGIHTWYSPYYDVGQDGNLTFRAVDRRPLNNLRSFLEGHSLLTFYVERLFSRVNVGGYKWEGIPIQWGVFGDPLNAEWKQAWFTTEKVLALLDQTVSSDGIKLITLIQPQFYEVDPDWRKRMIKEVGNIPPSFNPAKSEERLREIADRNNLTVDFLGLYMRSYRDNHQLKWPYFSLTCDPHYSALGHQVVAEAIVEKLEEHKLLPLPAEKRAMLMAIKEPNECGKK